MHKTFGMKSFLYLLMGVFIFFGFTTGPYQWEVPEKYQKMKNPIPATTSSIKIGKGMYKRHCRSCHGALGKGEGPRAGKLNHSIGDFTSKAFAKETDGAIFYKMTVGHDEMPSFEKKIPGREDIIEGSFGETGSVGDLINYIRTLAK